MKQPKKFRHIVILGFRFTLVRSISIPKQQQSRFLYLLYCQISTNVDRTSKSSQYFYSKDPKTPEHILSNCSNTSLSFKRTNMIDFWLVEFVVIKIQDIPSKNFVGWLKNNQNSNQYQHFCSETLMLSLKYIILLMKMPKGDINDLIILVMIYSILLFNLSDGIKEITQLELVCCPG